MPCPSNFIPMEEFTCQATIAFKARKTVALGKISPTSAYLRYFYEILPFLDQIFDLSEVYFFGPLRDRFLTYFSPS